MKSILAKWKSRHFLVVILFLQFIVYTLVFLDVPVARQIIVFLYLTFVPGIVIIKLLKLDRLDGLEIVLLSVGFSVAFMMLAGLFANEFLFLFGFSKPLSLMPLLITLNSLILLGAVLACLRNGSIKLLEVKSLSLLPSALLLMGLPVLSVVGTILVNAYGNNIILLFLMVAISLVFVVGVVFKKLLPPELYPLAVFVIAISLLYHSSLISNYLVTFGSDVPVEYFASKTTQNNAYWSSTNPGDIAYGRVNSMLSVTMLPTVYSTLLNMDSAWVFKILFPLIFSFVPLGLYNVWRRYIGRKYAFISAFFFVAYELFYTEMLGLNRQIVAELFFVLLLFTILNRKMKPPTKMVCFIVFSFGLVTSHYGLAEIFLFFVSLTLVSFFVFKRLSRNITTSMVVLLFVVMFTWYIYTSSSAVFGSTLDYGNYVYRQLDQFFSPASRGQTVLRGLGLESPPTIWNAISRAFAYVTQFLIVAGFVGLVTKRVRVDVKGAYFTFSFIAVAFLAALVLVPGLANTMNMTRFYHMLLFFLAPLCILGAEVFIGFVSKRKTKLWASILLLTVLIPYFLFQTSFVYEVTGSESWSISLSGYRMGPKLYASFGVITEQEILGARWLSQYTTKFLILHVDLNVRWVIWTYYMKSYSISWLSNVTKVEANDVVYLGKLNTVYGIVTKRDTWNTTIIVDSILSDVSKIYSNGDCEIYKNTTQTK